MSSLAQWIECLEADLKAAPPRISSYHDLPFAILLYDPKEEWELRRQITLLAARLQSAGREVAFISLAELLWKSVEESEGIEALVELERLRGFEAAEEQLHLYLSDRHFRPLPVLLEERLKILDPARHIVFLKRAAALAPAGYAISKLLDEMKGKTRVLTILFYPGSKEGTHGLRFMDLKDREPMGNYRVKIYG
ncbi:MAG: DUF1788 domain-containing protein [Planctomycetes bacterium]|nr:DUF1788 domain-containing protein [Planctomycetota bacterium]